MPKAYPVPLEGLPHRRSDSGSIRKNTDRRTPDWRFSVLADFEELIQSYGQDHVSIASR